MIACLFLQIRFQEEIEKNRGNVRKDAAQDEEQMKFILWKNKKKIKKKNKTGRKVFEGNSSKCFCFCFYVDVYVICVCVITFENEPTTMTKSLKF